MIHGKALRPCCKHANRVLNAFRRFNGSWCSLMALQSPLRWEVKACCMGLMTNGSMEWSFSGDLYSAIFSGHQGGFAQSRVRKHLKDAPRQLPKHYFISAIKHVLCILHGHVLSSCWTLCYCRCRCSSLIGWIWHGDENPCPSAHMLDFTNVNASVHSRLEDICRGRMLT
jgi:hypothetical protein